MTEPADELRAQFEAHKDRIAQQRQKAKELKAQANAIEAKTNEQLSRIEKGLPAADSCPDCWVERGEDNTIISGKADDPSHFDRWQCSVGCGYSFDVPTH